MPVLHVPDVPFPSSLLESNAPGYTREVAFLDATTGNVDGSQTQRRVYNATGGVLLKGAPYQIITDGDEETQWSIRIPIATTPPDDVEWGIAVNAAPDAAYCWVVTQGYCLALCDGGTTDIAKDDFLKPLAADPITLVTDGATRTADSMARACEAYTAATDALKKVYVLGDRPTDAD